MGFYSSISLATSNANVDKNEIIKILLDLGIMTEVKELFEGQYSAASWTDNFFDTELRKSDNEELFAPGLISFYDKILLQDLESESLELDGFGITFHGYGYFFPMTNEEIINEFCNHDKIKKLDNILASKYGIGLTYTGERQDLFKSFTYQRSPKNWTFAFSQT